MGSPPDPPISLAGPRKMTFDDILNEAGGFGRFQIIMLAIMCIPRIIIPLHFLQHIFISAVPPHHCAISSQRNPGNLSKEDLLLINIPQEPDGSFSSCKMYSQPQTHLMFNRSKEVTNGSTVQSCDQGWEYDLSTFSSTTITQWDVVCDQRGMSKALVTLFFIGVTTGAVIAGYLSDRFGRRIILLLSLLFTLIFGGFSAGSISYSMYAAFLTLTGFALAGSTITIVALSVEWVNIQHRTDAAVITSLCWTIGNGFLALLAYLLRDWRWLMVAITAPCIVGLLVCWWVPESARWLLAKGRVKEAESLLMRCAVVNGRSLDFFYKNSQSIQELAETGASSESYSYIDLFRTTRLRRICLCAGLVWFTVTFSYYGISLNITGLGFNIYLTHFLYALIEIPGKLSIYFLMSYLGRRRTQFLTLFMTGACIGVATGIPDSLKDLRIAVAIIGKGFSEATFTAIILYTAELYPTVMRQKGSGYTAFVGRIGASVAPLIMLLDGFWHYLPQTIFCISAVTGSLVACLLPETKDVHLPETIDDVECSCREMNGGTSLTELTPRRNKEKAEKPSHSAGTEE
ncbi:solute carrier family 22 member 7 isoform X2 [Hyperolius riggenbachi]